ncbi:hypothetical protein B0T17DRAFT_507055 [Bombardia bombarda]|uniref:Uncharacterized protein n=1 Tax=Bombardia bombarda TaxID=252184 RepID=A0AA39XAZ5_9PEZI|nr:hypothetical protein B0T17DRAFT_507055 [Bombardia bombarda]
MPRNVHQGMCSTSNAVYRTTPFLSLARTTNNVAGGQTLGVHIGQVRVCEVFPPNNKQTYPNQAEQSKAARNSDLLSEKRGRWKKKGHPRPLGHGEVRCTVKEREKASTHRRSAAVAALHTTEICQACSLIGSLVPHCASIACFTQDSGPVRAQDRRAGDLFLGYGWEALHHCALSSFVGEALTSLGESGVDAITEEGWRDDAMGCDGALGKATRIGCETAFWLRKGRQTVQGPGRGSNMEASVAQVAESGRMKKCSFCQVVLRKTVPWLRT